MSFVAYLRGAIHSFHFAVGGLPTLQAVKSGIAFQFVLFSITFGFTVLLLHYDLISFARATYDTIFSTYAANGKNGKRIGMSLICLFFRTGFGLNETGNFS